MQRFVMNLRNGDLVIDMRAAYYGSLLDAYHDALYGNWESFECLNDDGAVVAAVSVEILNEAGQPVLVFPIDRAFTVH